MALEPAKQVDAISSEDVATAFNNALNVTGSPITGVQYAFLKKQGNLVIFDSRVSKTLGTSVSINTNLKTALKYKPVSDIVFSVESPEAGGTGKMSADSTMSAFLRHNNTNSDYLDIKMVYFTDD